MIEDFKGKAQCNIHGDFGRCKHNSTKYIFGITICDNHYHILYMMTGNVIQKNDEGYETLANIISSKMQEEEE